MRIGPTGAALVALVALAACDKASDATSVRGIAASSRAGAAGPAADAAASAMAQRKLNAYVDAYNSLIGGIGLRAVRRHYDGLDIPHARPSTHLLFVKGGLAYASRDVKAARALPGSAPHDLDALADGLAPRLDALERELGALAGYYDAMSYQEDQLAKGRARHPVVVSLFDAAQDAATPFEVAVKTALAEREKSRLAALEAGGDALAYRSALAMSQARSLLESFERAPSVQSGSPYAGADRIAQALEATLGAQRLDLDRAKAATIAAPGSLLDRQETLVQELGNLLGRYRQLKASRDAYGYEQMLDQYNRAVDTSNRMASR